MAALVGRRRGPSTSSISRLARSVEDDTLDEVVPWLLCYAVDSWALLTHPGVLTRDHQGRGWHVFDFDHTRLALLQRPLPKGDDLPEPTRVSEEFAAAGYTALYDPGTDLALYLKKPLVDPPPSMLMSA